MPLFGKNNEKSVNYKARLEHKLYLARESPDLIFDLSECDLKTVPSGVYSLCKVFRKESLLLQKNNLSSLNGGGAFEDLYLLQILDLRCNNLSTLPDNIRYLTSLKELYLNNNFLKALPECITELKHLQVLSCSFNKLKRLPSSMGDMKNLERLYLQGNPALCVLPDNLCLAECLSELVLDVGRYTHPPDDTVLQGTQAVMSYLARKIGIEYTGPKSSTSNTQHEIPSHEKELNLLLQRDKEIQERLRRYEVKKDERIFERLSVEKDIDEQKVKEYQLQTDIKLEKTKLMEDLRMQEFKMAEEVQKFQSQKDADRYRLIKQLQSIEKSADEFINQMLEANSVLREPSRVLQQEELDRIALEKLFSEQSLQLRKKEILNAMESLLAEERMQKEKLMEYEQAKAEVVQSSISRELEWSEEVDALLSCRSSNQSALVASVEAEERDQVVAVATLLERNDLESMRLRTQLQMVEKQLAALTSLELKKNNFNLTQLQCDVSEKRAALSFLLVDILNQQQERKKRLLQTLIRMEHNRWEDNEGTEDYWLKQYQKLLDLMPSAFNQGLETKLVHYLVMFGVVHCLPFLGQCDLETVTDEDLSNFGIRRDEDRASVLKAIAAYYEEVNNPVQDIEPNAPPPEDYEPSAPSPSLTECVVCLNDQCEMVFVPCGHLCCCRRCSEQLADCPLCRVKLERKVRVISV